MNATTNTLTKYGKSIMYWVSWSVGRKPFSDHFKDGKYMTLLAPEDVPTDINTDEYYVSEDFVSKFVDNITLYDDFTNFLSHFDFIVAIEQLLDNKLDEVDSITVDGLYSVQVTFATKIHAVIFVVDGSKTTAITHCGSVTEDTDFVLGQLQLMRTSPENFERMLIKYSNVVITQTLVRDYMTNTVLPYFIDREERVQLERFISHLQ